jgi:hypothetical protein
MDSHSLTGGAGKPGQYVEMIGRLKNADQVKQAMTLLNQDIKAAQGAEKQVLIGIKEKLANLEKNSIMRAAIQTSKEGGMRKSTGEVIGREIVGDLKDARQGYRQLADDLGAVGENARLKMQKGPSAFLDAVESIPSERVQDKFFNVENNRQLMSLRDKFPEQFDLLKQGKLREIADAATDFSQAGRGETSSGKFLKAVRSLNDEAKQMLFGKDIGVINDIQQVQNALPKNFNPSGTATTQGWQEAVIRNVKDIPTYLIYKGASSNLAKSIGQKLVDSPKTVRYLENNPAALRTFIQNIESGISFEKALPMVADDPQTSNDRPTKGPDKWMNDGLDKIRSHDSQGVLKDSALVEKLKQSKKGRDLLIKASDLKPQSKAMDSIFKEIKMAYLKGGQ